MSKVTIVAAFAVGYVLGAKAGRDRYEEIMAAAGKVRNNPQVQRAAEQATETVRAQAPVVAEKVREGAGEAAGRVREKVDELRDDAGTADVGGTAPAPGAPGGEQPPAGPPPAS